MTAGIYPESGRVFLDQTQTQFAGIGGKAFPRPSPFFQFGIEEKGIAVDDDDYLIARLGGGDQLQDCNEGPWRLKPANVDMGYIALEPNRDSTGFGIS